MPELPEVETVKNGLLHLVGSRIKQVIIRCERLRYPLRQQELDQIVAQKILAISRRAKYVIFSLEQGYLIIHLGMSGTVTLIHEESAPLKKHDHVDLIFNSGDTLRYNDPRRFGCILYTVNLHDAPLLKNLGPEPFSEEFTAEYLYQKIGSRRSAIKQLIMDNTVVSGVGNIYASEVLFLSKISPLKPGNRLTVSHSAILVNNIRKVLQQAIDAGGSSLRDYKNVQGDLGYFQQQHFVYGRCGKPCKICATPILDHRLGQRNSFYCPNCQRF